MKGEKARVVMETGEKERVEGCRRWESQGLAGWTARAPVFLFLLRSLAGGVGPCHRLCARATDSRYRGTSPSPKFWRHIGYQPSPLYSVLRYLSIAVYADHTLAPPCNCLEHFSSTGRACGPQLHGNRIPPCIPFRQFPPSPITRSYGDRHVLKWTAAWAPFPS